MANPSKRKGTEYENEVLDLVHDIWPNVDRRPPGSPSCDLINTGDVVIECKHTKTWCFPEWVRKVRARAGNNPWAIFAGHGDRRSKTSVGDVVVFDREFAVELLGLYQSWMDGELVAPDETF